MTDICDCKQRKGTDMTTESDKDFQLWYDPLNLGKKDAVKRAYAWGAWQASEKRIKDKLLSDEMVERVAKIVEREFEHSDLDAIENKERTEFIETSIAKAALKAIVEAL